jgi:hypothetical protein
MHPANRYVILGQRLDRGSVGQAGVVGEHGDLGAVATAARWT